MFGVAETHLWLYKINKTKLTSRERERGRQRCRYKQTDKGTDIYSLKAKVHVYFIYSRAVWTDVRFDSSNLRLGQTMACLTTRLPSSCFYGVCGTSTLLMPAPLLSIAGKCSSWKCKLPQLLVFHSYIHPTSKSM